MHHIITEHYAEHIITLIAGFPTQYSCRRPTRSQILLVHPSFTHKREICSSFCHRPHTEKVPFEQKFDFSKVRSSGKEHFVMSQSSTVLRPAWFLSTSKQVEGPNQNQCFTRSQKKKQCIKQGGCKQQAKYALF